MEITLTQGILLLYSYSIKKDWKGEKFKNEYLKILLNGVSGYSKVEYNELCNAINTLLRTLKADDVQILDQDFYMPLELMALHLDPNDLAQVNDGFTLPHDFYGTSDEYFKALEAYIARGSGQESKLRHVVDVLTNDAARRVFETTLAMATLAHLSFESCSSELTFFNKVNTWNQKLYNCINIMAQKDHIGYHQALDWLKIYELLLAANLETPALKSPREIFQGWDLEEPYVVPFEVYDILNITCTLSAQWRDPRMNQQRRNTIRAVALSWLLIRIYVDKFNVTLYLYDALNLMTRQDAFRGRISRQAAEKSDRPIAGTEWKTDTTPWEVREAGIIFSRTPLPRLVQTYFTIPQEIPRYTFRKAVNNLKIGPQSLWAELCRERKVHTLVGGGSSSFLYISRMLLSVQTPQQYSTLFPGIDTSSTVDLKHDFTQAETHMFLMILSSLWVGVTGGHCYLEILFPLNMEFVVNKYREICNYDMRCSLMSFLGPNLRTYTDQVLGVVADYNLQTISQKRVNIGIETRRRKTSPAGRAFDYALNETILILKENIKVAVDSIKPRLNTLLNILECELEPFYSANSINRVNAAFDNKISETEQEINRIEQIVMNGEHNKKSDSQQIWLRHRVQTLKWKTDMSRLVDLIRRLKDKFNRWIKPRQ